MFHHRFNDQVSYRTYFDWFLLSFLAGNINTGGYLSCQRFVSHITGFASLAGISAAEGFWIEALGAITIPLFFLLGVMVSGFLTEKHILALQRLAKDEKNIGFSDSFFAVLKA